MLRREAGHAGRERGKGFGRDVGHEHLPEAQLVQVLGFVGPAGPGNKDARLVGHGKLVEVGAQRWGNAAGVPSVAAVVVTCLPVGGIEGW